MTSSQDDAILTSFGSLLYFCRRLQDEKTRNKYVEKTKINDERRLKTIKDDEVIEEDGKRQFLN